MEESVFNELPNEIKDRINSLVEETEKTKNGINKEEYALIWKKKHDLFIAQIATIGMTLIPSLETNDSRGAILLTYSGSLISLGPAKLGKRWLEYASIKFRHDVPDFVRGSSVVLTHGAMENKTAAFEGCALTQSSAVYHIAVCPEGTKASDQDERIREATIYLTNGFVKLNRTIAGVSETGLEQFTHKSIVNYVAKKNDVTQVVARSLIDDFVSTVEAGMLLGERVHIGHLGTASLRLQAPKKARVMKNISTGEDILVPAKPASYAPKFSFSRQLKDKSALVRIETDDEVRE
ncbi:MAG TPA: HU family DNA-binding protein [Treponemataceae bacterium]|nr:HU family DNA-binding protein [Treponemataceae bacterium]